MPIKFQLLIFRWLPSWLSSRQRFAFSRPLLLGLAYVDNHTYNHCLRISRLDMAEYIVFNNDESVDYAMSCPIRQPMLTPCTERLPK